MEARTEGIIFAYRLIEEIDRLILRVPWTNEEVDRLFAKRSGNIIIKEGNTFFMNPCLDLSLASMAKIKEKEIECALAIEEHEKTREFPFNRLHFAVEFTDPTGKYYINYHSGNIAKVGRGEYDGRKDIRQVKFVRFPGSKIRSDRPLHTNLGYESIEKALKSIFPGFNLETQIERLKADNTPENYNNYQKRFGGSLNVDIIN